MILSLLEEGKDVPMNGVKQSMKNSVIRLDTRGNHLYDK